METSLFATSKSKIIAFLLLFILLYVSKETTAQCSVYGSSPSSCSFSASGGSQTVTLFLSGSGCSDYCSNPLGWISVQRTGKGIFVITASANTGVARSGSLTFDIYTNTSYTLNVSQASACSIATPTISASGPTTFCPGGSVTLTSSAGTGYLWSNGQTSQSINVNSSGSYSVQITNSNGCKSASSAAITTTISSIPSAPTISASGSTTFCPGGSVTLFSSPGTSFLWSTGATSQSISVNSSGSYSVQITNSSGCQSASSSPVTVTLNPLPSTPTISASGSTTFCPGGSVTLTSSAGSTYRWSTGATSQSISVTSTGSYTVQTTNSSGCLSASSLPVTVSVNSLPTISISGTTTINIGNCTTLTASGAWSYLWSTGETGSSISVCPTSNTTYTVTGTSGECSSTKSVTVTVAPYITMSPSVNFGQSGGVTSYWVSTNIPSSSLSISYSGCVSSASISGTMVTVNCAANITGSTLTGSVTVSGGATSATTSVSQAPCLCTANAGASLANICQGGTTGPLGGSIGGTATGGTWSSSAGGTFSPGASTLNATWSSPSGFSGQAILTLTTTGGCNTATSSKYQEVYATPTTTTVGATQNLCGTLVSGSLGGNTPSVGAGAWSQVSGPGTTIFSAPASGISTATATVYGTYVYRWTISNGTCTASTAQVTVNYYATPTTATVGVTQNLCGTLVSGSLGGNTPTVGIGAWSQVSGPGTTTFSAPASGTSTATATVYGTYVYRWTISNGTCTPGTAQVTVNSYAPIPRALNSNMNYIQSRTILKDNVFSESIMDALTADDLQESITYFDGLGRPRQTVSWQASPAKKDIVVPVGYDNFGREDTKYLPYALTVNNNGAFVSADVAGQSTFYSGLINSTDGPNAFAKTEFESSPLNRVFKQGAPGLVWQPNMVAASDHSVKFAYGTNIASEVKRWKVAGDVLTDDGYYTAATLYKTTTWDENNDQTSGTASHTEEFKDLQGNVVLKVSTDGAIRFSTYYVYDDFELLRFVLPPKAMEDNAITGTELNDLCYHYRYDERKRMTMKQIPGADSISMVYDVRDRLVLSQDGASRTANNWLFTKYDQINRPIITGYLTSALNAGQLRAAFKNFTSPLYETSSATGNIGYSLNSSYPSSVTIAETNVLGVTYYDNYSYLGVTGFSAVTYLGAYDIDTYTDSDGTVNGYFDKVKGLVTGTKTKVLDSNEYTASAKWLYNANYYDDHYRVIQNRRSLYDGASGGVETSASLYDFPGKVKQTKQVQTFNSVTTTVDKYLTYDHAGRLTKTDQQITGDATNGKVTVAENSYNEIGQLVDKKLHNNAQQSIDYQYNIRGWLTAINNPDNLANDGTGDTYADLFAERLLYNDNSTISNLTLKNQYNGNICGIILNRRSDATAAIMKSAYGLTYDGLNRLNEATYAENTGSGYSVNLNAYNEFGITYDKNGNILTLKRNSAGTLVDNLAYTYESANKSNRLQAVADNSNNAIGFTDVTNTSDYAYDNNGNATKDLNKGITAILYNVLNLPKTVTKDANNSIVYTYTASGEKVMQATKISGITTNRYYAGLFEYDNLRALSLVKMDEGIVTKTSSTYVYEYYLKDHLGNTRITFRPGTTGPDLAQRTDYYPFGLAFTSQYIGSTGNSYLYNGKELQKALGWQVYDYGARFYDPQIGRWHVIDEKTEKYFSSSPYVYALNNPIKFVDPDGKKIRLVIRGENKQPDRTLTYNGGNAYWDDTYKKYDGKGGNITIDKTLEAYKKIEDSKDATIKKQLHTLETSKKIHWVEAPRQDGDGSGVKPFESGKLQSETKKMVEDGIPVGSVTYLDFSKESKDKFKKTEKVESTDLTLVTHEMQHQYDDDQGTNTDSYININTEENPAEIRAVNNENIVRGEEKRTTYGGKKIDPKKL